MIRKIFQWDENYPNIEIFKKDIDNQNLYVYRDKSIVLDVLC